jgi:hypothetical protein
MLERDRIKYQLVQQLLFDLNLRRQCIRLQRSGQRKSLWMANSDSDEDIGNANLDDKVIMRKKQMKANHKRKELLEAQE